MIEDHCKLLGVRARQEVVAVGGDVPRMSHNTLVILLMGIVVVIYFAYNAMSRTKDQENLVVHLG